MKTITSEYMEIVTTKIYPWLPENANPADAAFAAHVAVCNGAIYINAAPNNMTVNETQQLIDALSQAVAMATAWTPADAN